MTEIHCWIDERGRRSFTEHFTKQFIFFPPHNQWKTESLRSVSIWAQSVYLHKPSAQYFHAHIQTIWLLSFSNILMTWNDAILGHWVIQASNWLSIESLILGDFDKAIAVKRRYERLWTKIKPRLYTDNVLRLGHLPGLGFAVQQM